MLEREEYIEQAYLFTTLSERLRAGMPSQDVLAALREEVLATTKLPLAIDFLVAELRLHGVLGPAMKKLSHYFTPFQAYVFAEAEADRGRFDLFVGLEILRREAEYRMKGATPQGVFLYQFECLCRNRLGYDRGLEAMAADPIFDETWSAWIYTVRRQIGLFDLADLIYVRSELYRIDIERGRVQAGSADEAQAAVLFGQKEGQVALANRHKDPLLLFAALHRQMGYPAVPRPERPDEQKDVIPQLLRRMERLETRLKMMEDEQKHGVVDLNPFLSRPSDKQEPGSGGLNDPLG